MSDPVFKSIGLIGKYGDPGVADTLKTLGSYLQARGLRVLLDESTATEVPGHGLETTNRTGIGAQCDLAIVVGGDGTLLNAARSLADSGVPLLGVNLGRLGFLVDVSPTDMIARLDEILAGHYIEDERFLLHSKVYQGDKVLGEGDALNDVVIHKWDVARMIEFETYIDGRRLNTHRADGLIVATPTGSTAYALSGGGPIVHPALSAVVVVPICPHTLSDRPIMIGADSRIDVVIGERNRLQAQVTCDGQHGVKLEPGDRVSISKKERKVRLIHPAAYDYFAILRAKLHWGVGPPSHGLDPEPTPR